MPASSTNPPVHIRTCCAHPCSCLEQVGWSQHIGALVTHSGKVYLWPTLSGTESSPRSCSQRSLTSPEAHGKTELSSTVAAPGAAAITGRSSKNFQQVNSAWAQGLRDLVAVTSPSRVTHSEHRDGDGRRQPPSHVHELRAFRDMDQRSRVSVSVLTSTAHEASRENDSSNIYGTSTLKVAPLVPLPRRNQTDEREAFPTTSGTPLRAIARLSPQGSLVVRLRVTMLRGRLCEDIFGVA